MKKTILLNSRLSYAIARLGHTQALCIADSGLPIPPRIERIDLALSAGIPSFLQTLKAALAELYVEQAIFAQEFTQGERQDLLEKAIELLKEANRAVQIVYVSHEAFKTATKDARAIVRTGEQTPYANVLLYSGVPF